MTIQPSTFIASTDFCNTTPLSKVAAIAPGTVETGCMTTGGQDSKNRVMTNGALQPLDIARCVRFVLEQPDHVLISRMLAVPTNQPM